MERRLNTKVETYIKTFKDGIRDKIIELNITQDNNVGTLLEFIYEYDRMTVNKEDFVKRKRVKNSIPENNRCMAKRANGEQCTRRRKMEFEFCGTHSKGTPHGLSATNNDIKNHKQSLVVFAKEIQGIVYYIDNYKNVYNTEDIMQSNEDPRVVAQYVKIDDDTYTIPSLGLV